MSWIQAVAKALPKTAEELRTYLNSLLENLPPDEQKKFWAEVTSGVREETKKFAKELCQYLVGEVLDEQIKTGQLHSQLQKHRKPKKNAERDAEIMRLHGEKKTAGQIVLVLANRWKLTDKSVNAVISREKRKQNENE